MRILTGSLRSARTTRSRDSARSAWQSRSDGAARAASRPCSTTRRLDSLGSCQAITYRFWAAQLGISFDKLTVRLEGDLDIRGFSGFDDAIRPGFTAVRVEVTVTGPESAERYAELAAAVDEHCPVLDLFKNPVPVTRVIATATVTAASA